VVKFVVPTKADGTVFIAGGTQWYSPLNCKAYPGATASCGQLTIYQLMQQQEDTAVERAKPYFGEVDLDCEISSYANAEL
jgi:hypothetical protein